MRLRRTFAVGAAAVLLFAAACGSDEPSGQVTPDGPTITVGSANFPESIILAEIYAQGLESKGYDVDTKLNIGAREVYFPALQKGDIDVLPEYVGSLLSFVTKQKVTASPDSDEAYEQLTGELPDGVVALEASAAQDKDAIVANKETADQYSLAKVSDLTKANGQLILGGPPECETRQACLKGLQDEYGVQLKEFKSLDPSGPNTINQLKANEIQLANIFSTNPQIEVNQFVVLEDDKGIVGAENVVPVLRDEITEAYGDDLTDYLDSISAKLSTDDLTVLNKRVIVDQEDAEDVAADWLEENGLD